MQGAEARPTAPHIADSTEPEAVIDSKPTYSVEADTDVITVRMTDVREGWEQWMLLISDVHWDNPHCDRDLFHRLMRQAVSREARIFCFGDFFDCMGGKWDKRSNKEGIRPEHQTANYLDALVDTAISYLQPYRDDIVMFSPGNHETSIAKHHETDLMQRLCSALGIVKGGYSGYVRFKFSRGNSGRISKTLFYHHGYGGGGPVTRGVIDTNRIAVWQPDSDIVVMGHIHQATYVEVDRHRLSIAGVPYFDSQRHIRCSTYKQEHDLSGGWHTERGAPPKPLGGWWLRWHYDNKARGYLGLDVIRAS